MTPTDTLRHTYREAAKAALLADEVFSTALQQAYGKQAGDIRYQPHRYTPTVQAAYEQFRLANQAHASAWDALQTAESEKAS